MILHTCGLEILQLQGLQCAKHKMMMFRIEDTTGNVHKLLVTHKPRRLDDGQERIQLHSTYD